MVAAEEGYSVKTVVLVASSPLRNRCVRCRHPRGSHLYAVGGCLNQSLDNSCSCDRFTISEQGWTAKLMLPTIHSALAGTSERTVPMVVTAMIREFVGSKDDSTSEWIATCKVAMSGLARSDAYATAIEARDAVLGVLTQYVTEWTLTMLSPPLPPPPPRPPKRKLSRTERKLAQALAEIEALRIGVPEMQAALQTLANENEELRRALETERSRTKPPTDFGGGYEPH